MNIMIKLFITIIVIALVVFFSSSLNNTNLSKAVGASIVLGIWAIKAPQKEERNDPTSIRNRRVKNKAYNIFLLTIVACIIIMIILKFTVLG